MWAISVHHNYIPHGGLDILVDFDYYKTQYDDLTMNTGVDHDVVVALIKLCG